MVLADICSDVDGSKRFSSFIDNAINGWKPPSFFAQHDALIQDVTLELLPLDRAALGQSKAARRQQAVQAKEAAAAAAEARRLGNPS